MALNAWLWMIAMNAKLWREGGPECQAEHVAMNVELRGDDEGEYASMWRVTTNLDPQIIMLEEVS